MLEFILRPWHLIVLFLASQLNREQQRVPHLSICVYLQDVGRPE